MVTPARWSLAIRLFVRDWRSGEVLILLIALLVGVTCISAVTFFTDRVRQAVGQQAGEALAGDLRVESNYPLPEEYEASAIAYGVETADVVHFRSVIFSDDSSTLTDIRGVSGRLSSTGRDAYCRQHDEPTVFSRPASQAAEVPGRNHP